MAQSSQYQQALALKKQNPNLNIRDAVAQVRSTQAPTAPVATIPNGATMPIAPTVNTVVPPQAPTWGTTIAQPIAKAGDAVIWVGGERFVQANNYDGSTNVTWTPSVINQSGGDVSKLQEIQALATAKRYANNQANPTAPIAPISERANTAPTAPTAPTTPVTPTTPKIPTSVTWADPWLQISETPEFKASLAGNQAMEDAKNGIYRTPEYYDNIRKWVNPTPPPSADSILSSLKVWAPVDTSLKNTQEYRTAQARLNTFKKFSTFDVASLSTALSGWDLLMGTQAYNDLVSDPAMKAKIEKAQLYTSGKINAEVIWEKQGAYVLSNSPTVANALADGFMSQDEYNQLTNNAEVSAQAKIMWEKKTDYETKKAQYDAVEEDVDKEFAWKETTDSFKAKIAADRRKGMYKDLTIATIEYQNAMGTYTELKNSSTQLLETNMKLYETRRAEEAKIASEQRQNQMNRENMVFQADLWLQTKQAEFEQGLAQQAQLASDPVSAVKSTLKTFSDLWILADRSEAEIIADVQSKVASGIPLGTAISELQTAFKSKPQYQKALELNMWQLSDADKLKMGYQFDISKMGLANQFDLTKIGINNQADLQKLVANYNLKNTSDIQTSKIDLMSKWFSTDQADAIIRSATGNWKGATGGSLLSAPDGTIIPTRLSETTNGNGGKECAEYVNDITGAWLGSTWASKQDKIDPTITTPIVGNTAVWIPNPNDKIFAKYGHAGIITGVEGNNVTIKSSNLNGQGEVSTITIPISEITKTGGFVNTSLKWPWKTTWLAKDDVKNINGLYDDLKTIDTFKNWKAISSQVTWFNDLKTKDLNWSDIQGLITNYAKVLDPTSVVRESEFAMAQKWANQWVIDRTKTSIATYLNGWSATLSKEAQEALKAAMWRRFDAVKEAYVNEVDSQVARGKQMGMPVTWENLTGESRGSYARTTPNTTKINPLSVEDATKTAMDFLNWK